MRFVDGNGVERTNHQALVGVDRHLGFGHVGNVGNKDGRTQGALGDTLLGRGIYKLNVGVVLHAAVGEQGVAAPNLTVNQPLIVGLLAGFGGMSREGVGPFGTFGNIKRVAFALAVVVGGERGGGHLFDGNRNAVATGTLLGRGNNIYIVGGNAVHRTTQGLIGVQARMAANKAGSTARVELGFAPRVGGIGGGLDVETNVAAFAKNGVGYLLYHGLGRNKHAVVAVATMTVGAIYIVEEGVERTYANNAVGFAHFGQRVGRTRYRAAVGNAGAQTLGAGNVRVGFFFAIELVKPLVAACVAGFERHLAAVAEYRIVARGLYNANFGHVNRGSDRVGQGQVRGNAVDRRNQAGPNGITGFEVGGGKGCAIGGDKLVDDGVYAYRNTLRYAFVEGLLVGNFVLLGRDFFAIDKPCHHGLLTAFKHRIYLKGKERADTRSHGIYADVDARFERRGGINGKGMVGVGLATASLANGAQEERVGYPAYGIGIAARTRNIGPSAAICRVGRALPPVRIHLLVCHRIGGGRVEAYLVFAVNVRHNGILANLDGLNVARIGTAVAEYQTAEVARGVDRAGHFVVDLVVGARAGHKRTIGLDALLPEINVSAVAAGLDGVARNNHVFGFGAEHIARGHNGVLEVVVGAHRDGVGGTERTHAVGHLRAHVAVRAIDRTRQNGFVGRGQESRFGKGGPVGAVGGIFPVGARAVVVKQGHFGRRVGAEGGVVGRYLAYGGQIVYPQVLAQAQGVGGGGCAGGEVHYRNAIGYGRSLGGDGPRADGENAAIGLGRCVGGCGHKHRSHLRGRRAGGLADDFVDKLVVAATARNNGTQGRGVAHANGVAVYNKSACKGTTYHGYLHVVARRAAHRVGGREGKDGGFVHAGRLKLQGVARAGGYVRAGPFIEVGFAAIGGDGRAAFYRGICANIGGFLVGRGSVGAGKHFGTLVNHLFVGG